MAQAESGRDLARKIKREMSKIRFKKDAGRYFNPFSTLAENLCRVRGRTVPELARPKSATVRMAFVSMPEVRFAGTEIWSLRVRKAPVGVDPEVWMRGLAAFADDGARLMFSAFREALTAALEELRADIVCVSELGFPSRNLIPLRAAKRLAHEMSQEHKAMIIAGSAHDSRTLSNTGYLFYPGCPQEGVTFHKALSAVSVGERISAAAPHQVPAVEIFGLRIASMICLDIADYASLASVVRVADRVDMILVPCYTKRFEKLVDIARVASQALPGIVALVNADLTDSVAARCHVARFGRLESPARKQAPQVGCNHLAPRVRLRGLQNYPHQDEECA